MQNLNVKCILFCALSCQSLLFASQEPINIIWPFAEGEKNPDSYWIREVLREVPTKDVYDPKLEKILNKAIIVSYGGDNFVQYFDKFIQKGYQFGVFHLADEGYSHSTHYYDKAKVILRSYWHKKFQGQKNVHVIPLGYWGQFWKDGHPKSMKNAFQRAYVWSFAGQVSKSTRGAMIANMRTIPKNFVYEIGSFADSKSLTTEKYRNLMLNSIFVPCPKGWINLDSFRVWEALECGCIPIVEKAPLDYFTKAFGPHPFLSVTSWDEAPRLIRDLLANPQHLEEVRSGCYTWWTEYKKNMQQEVKKIVDEAFR